MICVFAYWSTEDLILETSFGDYYIEAGVFLLNGILFISSSEFSVDISDDYPVNMRAATSFSLVALPV